MFKRLIFLMMFVLALSSTAHAAVYLWSGSASGADGLWEEPINWVVTDSAWTWPNEENAADPNFAAYINSDVLAINIINGSAVTYGDTLRIKGGDELTAAVLTLDNGSSLTVSGRLAIGTDPDDLLRIGELNVLNGSTLTILDGENGNDLVATDDPNTVGTINIVDSTVIVFDDIMLDEGEATINIINSIIIADDFKVADGPTGVATLNVSGSTITLADDLLTDEGVGTINITDSIIVADDIIIANAPTGVGTMNVSGATTIDLDDDLIVSDDGVGTFNISGDAVLNVPDEIFIADEVGSEGHMTISGNATVNVVDDVDVGDEGLGTLDISENAILNIVDELYVATEPNSEGHLTISGNATVNIDDDLEVGVNGLGTCIISGNAIVTVDDDIDVATNEGSEGHLTISGNATVSIADELYIAPAVGATGHMDVNGTATLNIPDDLDVGDVGYGTCNISEDATVNVDDAIYIASDSGAEGHMTISGNATLNIGNDLIVANAGGTTASLHISGNPTIHIFEQFYMNDDSGDPSNSQVIMDGGTVTIDSYCTFNDDNAGTAEFIMNGGSFYCADYLNLSDNLDGTALLTMNGGEMITGNRLRLGKDGGDDTGQVRIFMNGGLLQAEELVIKITDTQIIYTGGVFRIGADDLDVAEMEQLIADGTIVIEDESLVYGIISNGIYTELNSNSPLVPQMPDPADGAEGVSYGSSLSWTPGDTAATNDVYFGTTNPPAFAASVEAEAHTYYPGPLEQGMTYYWQVDAVEADGTTKYSSDVWSFTATTKTKELVLDIRIAAGSDDAEEDVASFEIDLTSSDLEFMHDNDPADPNDEQVVGLRFVDIGIPKGTNITSASVQFDADDINDDRHVGDTHALIEGELSPNPGTFEDTLNNITARPRTTAIVTWDPAQWMETHLQSPDEATSDISSIIQEIVDQDGWAFGNALVLILSQDPDNPSVGIREAESFDGAGGTTERRPRLHIESAAIEVATQSSPANGAEGVSVDATLSWWPGVNAASHDVYLDTSTEAFLAVTTTYLVDVDSHSLPWEVADGTISFEGKIHDDGGDLDFRSAGASGDTLDVLDYKNWAKLSFDFDVDSVEFIYGGNGGNITVEARDKGGATIDSFYQADTRSGQPAGPITLSGPGIRSLYWKDTSATRTFAALDNILLTILPQPPSGLLGNTTQVGFDPGVLEPGTTYYWQVDTVETDGTIHTGAVLSFTTAPGEATQPDPADKAVGVASGKILSWKPGTTAAWHDVYFGTTSPPSFIGVQTESSFDPGPLELDTTYYWQVDEIEADAMTMYTGDVWSFKTPRPGMGTILYEIWEGIGGTSVSDLTGSPDYPYNSTSSTELSSFDAPVDRGDDFGGRLHGYLHPVTSGDYTFWIAADDNSELWLSTNESDANAVLISTVSDHTSHLDFDDSDVTPSGPIPLEGGQKYYILALYKEGGGGDNCAVAWEGPDSPTRAVIAGYYLSPYAEFKATKPDPADGTIEVQKSVTLSWTPGGTAVSHDVYLSTDEQAVIDGTAPVTTVTETSYSPADLEKGVTYYWRVDAVEEDGTTHTSSGVWSFTVTTLGR